jgi:hypothetical protein
MPTRVQWHVVRRLMPVMQGLMPVFATSNALVDDGSGTMVPNMDAINMFEAMAALANTIGMLTDADADYILDAALNCVAFRQGGRGGGWVPLRAPGGQFMNGTADQFDVQIRLLWEVLKESLSNFSFATVLPSLTMNGLDTQTATEQPSAA